MDIKNIELLKKKQRDISKKTRKIIYNSIDLENNHFYKKLNDHQWFLEGRIVASFISIYTEISTEFINKFILDSKKILCLPVINPNKTRSLIFKRYLNNENLKLNKHGIKEPVNSDEVLPDILLVPCLAYDEKGYRLGYGGGYYDKYISYLYSQNHNFITVGLAFDKQKVKEVEHNNLDQKLNYILTEKQLYKV